MRKDYHMHPCVIQGEALFDAFAEKAIEMGIDEVCITDHMPLSVNGARDRIPAGRVNEYCRIVRRIAERYIGRLNVKCGIEIDFHPDFSTEIERVLKDGDFDFVLGSVHMHVGQSDIFNLVSTRNEYAELSLKNTLLCAQSGYCTAISHLDMFRWVFTDQKRFPLEDDGYSCEKHLPLIDKVLDAIRDAGLYLEINTHLAAKLSDIGYCYPEVQIVEMALQKGLRFSFGSDAHNAAHVGAYLNDLHKCPAYAKALIGWESK